MEPLMCLYEMLETFDVSDSFIWLQSYFTKMILGM